MGVVLQVHEKGETDVECRRGDTKGLIGGSPSGDGDNQFECLFSRLKTLKVLSN